jgi:hypothetical protein
MVILLAVNVGLGNEIRCYRLDFLVYDRNPRTGFMRPIRACASSPVIVLVVWYLLVQSPTANCLSIHTWPSGGRLWKLGSKQYHSFTLQVHCTNGFAASYVCYFYGYFYRARVRRIERLCGLVVRVPGYRNQRTRVRLPALPDFLRSSGSGTGSTQPREYIWGATWMEK